MQTDTASITLSERELVDLTGYRQPSKQLAELLRRGFWRAYRNRLGDVILERSHFQAVTRGESAPAAPRRPQLRAA